VKNTPIGYFTDDKTIINLRKTTMKKIFPLLLVFHWFIEPIFLNNLTYCQVNLQRLYGVTVDAIDHLNDIETALSNHSKKTTVRIVFDEYVPASQYDQSVKRLSCVSDVMGEILDSWYFKRYSIEEYQSRVREYVDRFQGKVAIWEIGNEINGEWLGRADTVVEKISYAFAYCRKLGLKTAVTLYYNKDCWENPENEMFRWVNTNIPVKLKYYLDYVFVSYYEDDCNNYQPNWQQVFDSLHAIFPNSLLGIGECGTAVQSQKAAYMTRYYTMQVTTPGFIGGFFWWYYKQDCVPFTKPLWTTLNNLFNITEP
jgi:hypothetical protein